MQKKLMTAAIVGAGTAGAVFVTDMAFNKVAFLTNMKPTTKTLVKAGFYAGLAVTIVSLIR